MRKQERVGLVYVVIGATSTGAFHEGINFAAVQRCPLVVVVENNGYAYSDSRSQADRRASPVDKAVGYGIAGGQADGNDVSRHTRSPSAPSIRARRWSVTLIELIT